MHGTASLPKADRVGGHSVQRENEGTARGFRAMESSLVVGGSGLCHPI